LKLIHKSGYRIKRLEIALLAGGALGLAVFNGTLLTAQRFDWTILGVGSLALGMGIAIEVTSTLRRVLPEVQAAIEGSGDSIRRR